MTLGVEQVMEVMQDDTGESDSISAQEWASMAISRSRMYGFLAAVYNRRPDDQFVQGLSSPELVDLLATLGRIEDVPEDTRDGAHLIEQYIQAATNKSVEELRTELAVDRTRLLRGIQPGYGPPPPYESVYVGIEPQPQMQTSVAVTRAYAEAQVILPEEVRDQPDFIGFELDFMRHLCLKESEAWRGDDPDQALKYLEKELGFLNEHITRWIPRFCDVMGKKARLDFYRGIARLTKGFVLDDAQKAAEYLENVTALAWTDSDIDKLVDAFSNENIAPTIPGLDFTRDNVERLLATSNCRQCGWCCKSHSFILVGSEDDLKQIAKHSKFSYKYLKERTVRHKNQEGEESRYLPQPCMFYEDGKCQIYDIRPFACRVYPISGKRLSNGKVDASVNVHCDYGKDIYKGLKIIQK